MTDRDDLIREAREALAETGVPTRWSIQRLRNLIEALADALTASLTPPVSLDGGSPTETHRWNVERTERGVRICYGEHHRSAGCEWVEFVPPTDTDRLDWLERIGSVVEPYDLPSGTRRWLIDGAAPDTTEEAIGLRDAIDAAMHSMSPPSVGGSVRT